LAQAILAQAIRLKPTARFGATARTPNLSMRAVTVNILIMLAIGDTSAAPVAADSSCPPDAVSLLQTKTIVATQGQSCTWSFAGIGIPTGNEIYINRQLDEASAKEECLKRAACKAIGIGYGSAGSTFLYDSAATRDGTDPHWWSISSAMFVPSRSCRYHGDRYASVGIGECMTPQGPRGNHCYDGPSFNAGTVRTRAMCQEECGKIGHCSAYEWGRNNHYNCALYIHTSTTMPPELSPHEWICNFWSAGPAGVNEVSWAHNFGHSGECFVKQSA